MEILKHTLFCHSNLLTSFLFSTMAAVFFTSCSNEHQPIIGETKVVVAAPAKLNPTTSEIIRSSLKDAMKKDGNLPNHHLRFVSTLQDIYKEKDFQPLWTNAGKWTNKADSLFQLIGEVRNYGLFPEDYFLEDLSVLRNETITDTANKSNKLDAALWAETDLLLTSALVNVVKDLKVGRLIPDSIVQKDTVFNNGFFVQLLDSFQNQTPAEFAASLEPRHTGYQELKTALQDFLPGADFRKYTFIDKKDSLVLMEAVCKRLSEEDSILYQMEAPDSTAIAGAVKRYQKARGLKVNGKISSRLIDSLNWTDREKFIRIAITMDRYKQLPKLPEKYIWVNIPTYQLQVKAQDSILFTSKVVVGNPNTRTPVLTSVVSDMITYPKWHIPNSIIAKEILPNLKKDRGYLAKKGYLLADYKGNEIDPLTVDWSKYEKTIPYRVIQGSGDDNALGVLKFNFPNKFSVYLHDTNQRHLFDKGKRALSHGCVRVQAWEQLAYYLLEQDTASVNGVPADSLQTWLALKEKHVIPLRNRLPLYIRYFTCEAEDGKLTMHEDIYGDDQLLRQKYFKNK